MPPRFAAWRWRSAASRNARGYASAGQRAFGHAEFTPARKATTSEVAHYWADLIEDTVGAFYFCRAPARLVAKGVHEAKYLSGLLTLASRHSGDGVIALETFHSVVDQGIYPRGNLKVLEELSRLLPESYGAGEGAREEEHHD